MFLNPWYANVATTLGHADKQVEEIQNSLKPGWSVHTCNGGRLYYCNHATQTSSWLPPIENWDVTKTGLPYGWEAATDKNGRIYYINHLNKTTTYEAPRSVILEEPPQPREVLLQRHPDMGFGFVAGSEKPVIVRFVTEGGPSVDKLLPGDQILKINEEDVKLAPRDHVIQLVRSAKETVTLTVCQPPLDNSTRKSALLSAAKKAKLKSNPSRVRFAEGVVINGSPLFTPSNFSSTESCVPFMPNVLKVFLENGQTKSFKYDSSTTVQGVLDSLRGKLAIKSIVNFALVVEHIKSLRRNKLTILDPKEKLAMIAARPGAHHLRCLFRVTFVPKDAYDLLRKDTVAFEYLYTQCCNDVVQERFAPELKYDIALRLAALHIQQHALSNNFQGKITVKAVERETGLERFVPASLVETMKRKELRKLLSHFLKLNQNLTAPGQKQLTALQAKLHYLKIISELPSYGAKCFSTNLRDSNMETVILISPKFGVSQITGIRNSLPLSLCDIENLTRATVTREDELSHRVELTLKDPDQESIVFSLEDRDADELVLVLAGYYQLLTERVLPVEHEGERTVEEAAPPYHTKHRVKANEWSFLSTAIADGEGGVTIHDERDSFVDLTSPPPYQSPTETHKVPNGHVTGLDSDYGSDSDSNMATRVSKSSNYNVDRNMNKTLETNANLTTTDNTANADNNNVISGGRAGFDVPSVVSMEIMEDNKPVCTEARNDEVIRRVAEMKQMVHDAEQYLTDHDGEMTDVESVRSEVSEVSSQYGKLKHSDSLLLLTQGNRQLSEAVNEAVSGLELTENEPSESDTDSMSTPTNSPSHKPVPVPTPGHPRPSMLKPSDSSFGLHSPDSLPAGFDPREHNIQELLKQLQDNNALPYNFAEGTLILDPDIIDLTMIPPPITPDDEGVKLLPTQLSTPPTPFADRGNLETELKALERDLGDLRMLNDPSEWQEADSDTSGTLQTTDDSTLLGNPSDLEDTLSLSSLNMSTLSTDSVFTTPEASPYSPQNLAALRQLDERTGDIDLFIANVTVPPPPSGPSPNWQPSTVEVPHILPPIIPDDISAYIIPPPPSSISSDSDSEMIQKLCDATEEMNEVVHQNGNHDLEYERDRQVGEIKVTSDQKIVDKISPRIASLRQKFIGDLARGGESKTLVLNLTKDNFGYPSESGYASMASNVSLVHDNELKKALQENEQTFKSFNNKNSPTASDESKEIRRNVYLARQAFFQQRSSSVDGKPEENNSPPPPPPPPRTGIPRVTAGGKKSPKHGSSPVSRERQQSPSLALTKSSSHSDIMDTSSTSTILKSPTKAPHVTRIYSASSEDLSAKTNSPTSPSNISLASSSDSLSSQVSQVTVKSASSVKSLDNGTEDVKSPPLPPRAGQITFSHKPSLPMGNKQTNKMSPTNKDSPEAPGSPKPPQIPSRLRKPLSPTSKSPTSVGPRSPTKSIKPAAPPPPGDLRSTVSSTIGVTGKPAAPPPPLGNVGPKPSVARSPTRSPKSSHSPTDERPVLPQKNGSIKQGTGRKLPVTPTGGTGKAPMPDPNTVESPKLGQSASSPKSPSKLPRPNVNGSTSPVKSTINGVNESKNKINLSPLHTSSPKVLVKNSVNYSGKISINSRTDYTKDNKLNSEMSNFETDSLENSFELEESEVIMNGTDVKSSPFHKAEVSIEKAVRHLDEVSSQCAAYHTRGGGPLMDENKFQLAKDSLTNECRQFVTASKLFVKSATESEGQLLECLLQCVNMLQRIVKIGEEASRYSPTPLQTRNLVLKIKDVAETYLQTVQAASTAVGKGLNDPSMNTLMQRATALAGVLTSLMRTLRVFAP